MKKKVIGLMLAGICTGFAGPKTIPCHNPEFFKPEQAAIIRKVIPESAEKYEKMLRECREKLNDKRLKFSDDARTRIGKRLEMAEKSVQIIRNAENSKDPDDVFFVPRMQSLLDLFQIYFAEEVNAAQRARIAPKVISVRSFGAKGDGKTDDSAAFHAAFAAAEKERGNPIVIKVPKGIYFLNRIHRGRELVTSLGDKYRAPDKSHLVMTALANVTLEGESPENTILLFGVPKGAGISIVNCSNVSIRNFTLQNQKKPFMESDILAVDSAKKTFTVRRIPGSTPFEDPVFNQKRYLSQAFKNAGGDIVTGWFFTSSRFKKTAADTYELKCEKGRIDLIRPGMRFAIFGREGGASVHIFRGKLNTVENVIVRDSWNLAFASHGTMAATFSKCRILPAEGFSFTTNGDGLHCPACPIGPAVLNCEFRAMGDDPFNAYSKGMQIFDLTQEQILTQWQQGPGVYPIVSSSMGQILAECTVLKSGRGKYQNSTVASLTVKKTDFPAVIRTMANLKKPIPTLSEEHKVYMNQDQNIREDQLYNYRSGGAWSIISGCHFVNNRNCGSMLQCDNTLLENTTIENMESHSVKIGGATTWREGPSPINVMVRNCTIRKSGRIRTDFFVGTNAAYSPARMIRYISILHNKIYDSQDYAFSFDNVEHLELIGNQVFRPKKGMCVIGNAGSLLIQNNELNGRAWQFKQ